MWAYMESSRLYAEVVERGEKVRPTKFTLVEGGNHFVSDLVLKADYIFIRMIKLHYDMPDVFLKEVVRGCTEF